MSLVHKITDTEKVRTHLQLRPDSDRYLAEQSKEFNLFLNALEQTEDSRNDVTTKLSTLLPIDLGKEWVIANEYGREFTLSEQAIGQIGASREGAALRPSYVRSLPTEYENYDVDGERITVNMRDLAFMEAVSTRPRTDRVFREIGYGESEKVLGIVSDKYPLKFSDHKLIKATMDVLKDTGIKFKPAHFRFTPNGTVNTTFFFPDIKVENAGRREENYGIFLKNNSYGDGVLSTGYYAYTMVCTNGMMGIGRKDAFRVRHYTEKSFIKDVIETIHESRKILKEDKEFFEYSPEFSRPTFSTEYYKDHFDDIYHQIGLASLIFALKQSTRMQEKYKKAVKTYVRWADEIHAQVAAHAVSKKVEAKILEVAKQDRTIELEENKPGTLYDVSAAFTSAANMLSGDGSILLQEIGGSIIQKATPITPVIKV